MCDQPRSWEHTISLFRAAGSLHSRAGTPNPKEEKHKCSAIVHCQSFLILIDLYQPKLAILTMISQMPITTNQYQPWKNLTTVTDHCPTTGVFLHNLQSFRQWSTGRSEYFAPGRPLLITQLLSSLTCRQSSILLVVGSITEGDKYE